MADGVIGNGVRDAVKPVLGLLVLGGEVILEKLHHHGGDLAHKGRVDVSANMTRHDEERLVQLISNHMHYTGSGRAKEILDNWESFRPKFVKVMPVEYRRALEDMERMRMGVAAE